MEVPGSNPGIPTTAFRHFRGRRRQGRDALYAFRRLNARPATVRSVFDELVRALDARALNERSRADLQHVAHAAAGGADYLVTRDRWLIREVGRAAAQACSVVIRSPAELALELDRRRRTGAYAPGLLAETSLRLETLEPGEVEVAAAAFVSHGHGERQKDFVRRLRSLVAEPRRWRTQIVTDDDSPVALMVWAEDHAEDEIAVLRVRQAGPLASTVTRQLLYARRYARARGSGGLLRVTEPYVTTAVGRALGAEAFAADGAERKCTVAALAAGAQEVGRWLREPHTPPAAPDTVAILERNALTADQAAQLEARLWPLKILDAPLPVYLVPIKPYYAEELLDARLAEQTLLPRQLRLGVSREHVYYRSPRPGRLQTPARLVWYVSSGKRPGVQAVRAVSRLEEVIVDKPRRLHGRFSHLGIYELSDLKAAARGGKAMALRFADTEPLPVPVSLSRLRHHAREHGHTLVLQSVSQIPPGMFADLYREATEAERQR